MSLIEYMRRNYARDALVLRAGYWKMSNSHLGLKVEVHHACGSLVEVYPLLRLFADVAYDHYSWQWEDHTHVSSNRERYDKCI